MVVGEEASGDVPGGFMGRLEFLVSAGLWAQQRQKLFIKF
jgi:hypothetical protein